MTFVIDQPLLPLAFSVAVQLPVTATSHLECILQHTFFGLPAIYTTAVELPFILHGPATLRTLFPSITTR